MNFNAWVTSSRGKIHSVCIISLYNNKLKAVLKFIFLCIIDNVTVNDGFEKCVDESNVERCEREREVKGLKSFKFINSFIGEHNFCGRVRDF